MSETSTRVQQESVQSLYNDYLSGNLLVNRRYQRKLVWTLEDKRLLVNTIAEGYPLPLILLAEVKSRSNSQAREIVDGMQRLNAIFAFIENEFGIVVDSEEHTAEAKDEQRAVNKSAKHYYFNLEALASTFAAMKSGDITQGTPVLDLETSRRIVEYQIGTSSFSGTVQQVDEVFRRINSAGKKLSSQEVRQAGILSPLARMVRELSAYVRGDDSKFERLKLSEMADKSINFEISGTRGIPANDTFWVKNGVFPQTALRESKDEELILDILLDMILDDVRASTSENRNKAYSKNSDITKEIEANFELRGEEFYKNRFILTYETLRKALEQAKRPLKDLLKVQANEHSLGRKFQILFLTIDRFLQQNKHIADSDGFAEKLRKSSPQFNLPGGGKSFATQVKSRNIESLSGGLASVFQEGADRTVWTESSFERELANFPEETELFEKKAFFGNPDDSTKKGFQEQLDKYIMIAAAITNTCVDEHGVMYFGVADSKAHADDLARKYDIAEPIECNGHYVVGTEFEVKRKGGVDAFKQQLQGYISHSKKVDEVYAVKLSQSLQMFEYRGRIMWKMVPPLSKYPIKFDGAIYFRNGSTTPRVSPGEAEFDWQKSIYDPGVSTDL